MVCFQLVKYNDSFAEKYIKRLISLNLIYWNQPQFSAEGEDPKKSQGYKVIAEADTN